MKKYLLIAIMIAAGITALAQYPTTVTNANNCILFRTFTTSDEGFSSPSIYSSAEDVSFFWNSAAGAEIENSGLVVRSSSLISPVYVQTTAGQATVGFRYTAPVGTQYRIRIISGATTPPIEVLATTANGPVYTVLPGTSGSICLQLNDLDLTVGRAVRFEFTFSANQPGNILFDDLALNNVAAGPLPITFQGFVARKNNDGTIKLLWEVGTEINVKGYYVESSTNGAEFTNFGYISASGKGVYSFDYMNKPTQTMFFRVKSVDFDGSSKYTAIIKVYTKDQANAAIQIYPVPARDMVTIQHSKSSERSIFTLVSPDGKVLKQVIAMPNTLQTQLHINNLQNGLYILKYDDGHGDVQSLKIIKN